MRVRGWQEPAAIFVVVLVVVGFLRSTPRPALSGAGLVVLLAVAAVALGAAGLWYGTRRRPLPVAAELALFAIVLAGSAALVWMEPDGPGFLGGFVAVNAATMRLRTKDGLALAGVVMVVLAVAGLIGSHRPLTSILVNEVGVVAFYRIGRYTRQLNERRAETERLLLELRDSKAALLRSAALAERTRLAREMHDVLAHSLSGLMLQLEGARLLATRDPVDPRLPDTIERAHHLGRSGLAEARRAIGMLRDDELPVPAGIGDLTDDFERDTGVPCALVVTGTEGELPAEARLTLYRVTQEALTNIQKHAEPDTVHVQLDHDQKGARLRVEDVGHSPATATGDGYDDGYDDGYGLTGMRERAELLGGTLTAGPTERGFLVELWIPA
ncbi:MAG TPA: histidine kinase [Pseudonocardiaceae bacterium]|jgi:signal transduction histidine kinase|nr:histidine kinase [Pseudonocardiaceae bacterium]